MKKFYFLLLILFIVATSVPVTPAAAASGGSEWLDTSNVSQGVVGIQYNAPQGKRTKLMITKDGSSYTYNLFASKPNESFPLQQGSGSYKVSILENISGNKYKVIYSDSIDLSVSDPNAVYLSSVQNVKWNSSDKAIQKAKQLTRNADTDKEKVTAIYNYIVSNVKYDYALAATVPSDYVPDIDRTLASKKGICYDYASLFAAMLRSVNVPAKLVMGESSYVSQYHAWNEVLIDGQWATIDTTVDAGLGKSNKKVSLVKSASKYTGVKYY
ncbi:transglutaminase-like putative cysteine protease [Paenibacillus forsythiae]|uniref:Transglutaminase-like putative cysteine protease n=1 Tax=Paenibacillus forsythiae TaxID=365616 RepID=A0ABU3HEZ8_9BACL|nr:transglutaminase-like domain-containing protein [Paenibacillus forsythiae]MDT3429046.1 transglutaminase-like putative cysteine protease [Paenibacillus forsythiae]